MAKRSKNKTKKKKNDPTIPSSTLAQRTSIMQGKSGSKTDNPSSQDLVKDSDGLAIIMPLTTPDILLLLDDSWEIDRLKAVAFMSQHGDQPEGGNSLYRWWFDRVEYATKWGLVCTGYDDNFSDPPEQQTWEDTAGQLFEKCQNDPQTPLVNELSWILDFRNMPDEDTPAAASDWETRIFLFGFLAAQCPLMITGYKEEVDDETLQNRYWDKEEYCQPILKLRENQAAAFSHISEQLDRPITMSGMLTRVETTQFLCSCLRLLWFIKCTPATVRKITPKAAKSSSQQLAKDPDITAALRSQDSIQTLLVEGSWTSIFGEGTWFSQEYYTHSWTNYIGQLGSVQQCPLMALGYHENYHENLVSKKATKKKKQRPRAMAASLSLVQHTNTLRKPIGHKVDDPSHSQDIAQVRAVKTIVASSLLSELLLFLKASWPIRVADCHMVKCCNTVFYRTLPTTTLSRLLERLSTFASNYNHHTIAAPQGWSAFYNLYLHFSPHLV
mmetsp:Transcript_7925/g.19139  ORF Transcript_7925/g.19139 Transcript_7925/m.19139 type:complete len:498 (-) Transcript_7925:250-1743(-)|eukprot:CAMPEP_0113639284 /NCGR_PEP_ID=MMETSP0017_2-20120614/20605_1 /TAXON_ID=2856 /ORGANISM="Cylindrotheca closterium" /LENGTH=497 /DNA_ID=CAMNT_0000550483 /DNA_START=1994 /DNA_END=3487 /DNA_ORIENTATION=+ /assembly_acc=CAM_ASM_000147